MTKHIFFESKDISDNDNWGQLNIVDGGLSLCKICGCLEGGLATECPGENVSMQIQDLIYRGKMDYIDGKWQYNKLNPTNKIWLFGSYVRYNKDDEAFAEKHGLNKKYFQEIKQEWINRGLNISKLEKRNSNAGITRN
jgi:hypothetical protein